MTTQNSYNQPPMQGQGMAPQGPMTPPLGGMMPPHQIPPHQIPPQMPPQMSPMQGRQGSRGWRDRWMRRFGMNTKAASFGEGELTMPNWLTGKAMIFFFVAMFTCYGIFGYVPPIEFIIVAGISVVLFLYGSLSFSKTFERSKEKRFVKNLFVLGVIIRFAWVAYLYFFFNQEYFGNTFGDDGDVSWYMPFGAAIADWIRNGFDISFHQLQTEWKAAIDDVGYPIWLSMINLLTDGGSDVFVPLLIKCVIGSYSAILIYRVAKRHFGEGAARLAAIFICLNPNMIYWCGTMLKETEMVFLVCVAVNNFDRVLSTRKRFTFRNLLPGLLAGLALMFFRTVLGLVIFIAVFAHIVMASHKVMSFGKKILAGILVSIVLLVAMGDRIRTQTEQLLETVQSDAQKKNMEWRANRKEGGNKFAQYAGKAVFAPLIFSIPFPTFNQASETQILQMQQAGGYYLKNVLSFFVILVMFMMLISGEWRRHVFVLAYTLGYLIVLVMSFYAQSGRFHMPIMPMLMLFAAYGVQVAKTNAKMRRWFNVALVIEVVVCLAWNWFKLKGRGMI